MALGIIGAIGSLAQTWLEGRVFKTKARAEAEAKAISLAAQSAKDWETQMAINAKQSWKDEWLTILFSIPLVLCFIPSMVPFVQEGFRVLETMPTFYQYGLSIVIASSFGVRGAIGIMNKKKP